MGREGGAGESCDCGAGSVHILSCVVASVCAWRTGSGWGGAGRESNAVVVTVLRTCCHSHTHVFGGENVIGGTQTKSFFK